ncbi:MAG TPA: helix-turn-helix domain-containing protein [Planktothrix sp.]|jgi:transcriptional regulator with XRE-family HTH domain
MTSIHDSESREREAGLAQFGLRVLDLRQRKGLSQETLADRTGVTRSYLGEIERGKANPTLSLMLKISGALDTALSDLTSGIEAQPAFLQPAHILIADVPKGQSRLKRVLHGYELALTRDLVEAKVLLDRSDSDLIIGGVHFSEGRIFDLLRMVKADADTKGIPFICFRELPVGMLPVFIHESIEVCARALGAAAVLESEKYVNSTSPDSALRADIEQFLPREKRLSNAPKGGR